MNKLNRTAFTIVELLIVIVVIGILAGLVGNQWLSTRQNSEVAKVTTNARKLKDTFDAIIANNQGELPENDCLTAQLNQPLDFACLKEVLADNFPQVNELATNMIVKAPKLDLELIYFEAGRGPKLDGQTLEKPLWIKFYTGKQTDCKIGEAVFVKNQTADLNGKETFRKQPTQQKLAKYSHDESAKSNFCLVPINN